MKKMFLIVFIFSSCNFIQKFTNSGARTANRLVTMTNQQQTDSIVKYSGYFNTIFKGFVTPDKNFKVGPNGTMTLADTIFVNTILTKKKFLTIGIDTVGMGIDTLIINPPHQ